MATVPERRPRVVFVSPVACPGGAERVLLGVVRHLPALGLDPTVVLLEDGPIASWFEDAGCPVQVFPMGRTRQLHRTAIALARLRSFLHRTNTDVVVTNQTKGHVLGGLAAWGARTPAVWWEHGIPGSGAIERIAARVPAEVVICGSRAAAAAQRQLTPELRVSLVHPGIDVAAFSTRRGSGADVRHMLGWNEFPIVGIVGRLQPWKGQETFLRAASIIAGRHPEVRFAVVGGAILGWEGDYPARLRSLAAELGIADRVHFAGHQEDVAPWFDALDVVVHASAGEPFGLVLVEAMALGRPLVAAASGGPLDIVEHERSGVLVPTGDHVATADEVCRILTDRSWADALGRAAAARACAFSESVMARGVADAVRSALGSRALISP